jgi:hypothetical protein
MTKLILGAAVGIGMIAIAVSPADARCFWNGFATVCEPLSAGDRYLYGDRHYARDYWKHRRHEERKAWRHEHWER